MLKLILLLLVMVGSSQTIDFKTNLYAAGASHTENWPWAREQSGNYSDKLNFPAVESPQESMQKLQIILINMLCDSLLMILNALLMQTSSFRI